MVAITAEFTMRAQKAVRLLFGLLALAGMGGCAHKCHRPPCPPPAAGFPAVPPPAVSGIRPPAFPGPGAVGQPLPQAPPGGTVPQPFPPGPPAPAGQPPPPPPFPPATSRSGFEPPVTDPIPTWQAPEGSIRLAPPEPTTGRGTDEARSSNSQPPAAPPKAVEERRSANFPVGIPGFAVAREGVASGLRPMLDDGLDWLRANGYRTVLHVRKPGEDDAADRKQVEKRGLRYLTIEVSPATLTRPLVADFSRTVTDSQAQPLFVYDRDGALAGALWYLHFRTADQLPEEVARVRAGGLGFREDRDESHRAMWQAAQRLLRDQQ